MRCICLQNLSYFLWMFQGGDEVKNPNMIFVDEPVDA